MCFACIPPQPSVGSVGTIFKDVPKYLIKRFSQNKDLSVGFFSQERIIILASLFETQRYLFSGYSLFYIIYYFFIRFFASQSITIALPISILYISMSIICQSVFSYNLSMTDKISCTLYLTIYLSKMLDTMLIRSLSRDKIKLVLSLTRKYRPPFPKRLKWRHHHYLCEIGVILKKTANSYSFPSEFCFFGANNRSD